MGRVGGEREKRGVRRHRDQHIWRPMQAMTSCMMSRQDRSTALKMCSVSGRTDDFSPLKSCSTVWRLEMNSDTVCNSTLAMFLNVLLWPGKNSEERLLD